MVVAFGELLWDLLPAGKQIGGAVANCAFRLHQLGTPVSFVSRIGKDLLGNEAGEVLANKGMVCPLLQTDPLHPTGTVEVTVSAQGDAEYLINEGVAYDFIECTSSLLNAAASARVVVFGSLIQRAPTSRNTLYSILDAAPNALKVVDINLRKNCFTVETVRQSLERADVLKLSGSEVETVASLLDMGTRSRQDFCDEVAQRFSLQTILVSLGAEGVYGFDTTEGTIKLPGIPTKVADTVGAGDNFTAGFIHKRLANAPFLECCEYANVVGSLVATKVGGMPSITVNEIEQYRDRVSAK